MYVKKKKKGRGERKKKKKHIPMNSVLKGGTFLFVRVRNSLLQDGLILRILKNVLKLLEGQVRIRTTNGKAGNRGWGDYQRRTILHSLR